MTVELEKPEIAVVYRHDAKTGDMILIETSNGKGSYIYTFGKITAAQMRVIQVNDEHCYYRSDGMATIATQAKIGKASRLVDPTKEILAKIAKQNDRLLEQHKEQEEEKAKTHAQLQEQAFEVAKVLARETASNLLKLIGHELLLEIDKRMKRLKIENQTSSEPI
jgi:hypothetical protein